MTTNVHRWADLEQQRWWLKTTDTVFPYSIVALSWSGKGKTITWKAFAALWRNLWLSSVQTQDERSPFFTAHLYSFTWSRQPSMAIAASKPVRTHIERFVWLYADIGIKPRESWKMLLAISSCRPWVRKYAQPMSIPRPLLTAYRGKASWLPCKGLSVDLSTVMQNFKDMTRSFLRWQ